MGTAKLNNPHLFKMKEDFLYHLGINTHQELEKNFHDVKFIIMGGTPRRMYEMALEISKEIKFEIPTEYVLRDISAEGERFSMYKVGPIVTVNHGMGCPSISILLHELIKLVAYAKCIDPVFIRLGTCGGLGVPPGTVCISSSCINGLLKDTYDLPVLGKITCRPTRLDGKIAAALKATADELKIEACVGKTMTTDDFYEGQARLDGACCTYSEANKLEFLKKVQESGGINIEMEGTVFAALTSQASIRSAIVCTALLDRLKGDQISTPPKTMDQWKENMMKVVCAFIKKQLNPCASFK